MPSLRKRVSSYFRQLSFHNEPRDKRHNINENSFVTKYLQGQLTLKEGPAIVYGKNPTDLPNYELDFYETGPDSVIGCYSGPNGGLTTVKRTEKHLSMLDAEIDYIDTLENADEEKNAPKLSPIKMKLNHPVDNTTMVIRVAGQEYCVTNRTKRHSKSHSLGSITDFGGIEIEKTKIDKDFYTAKSNNNNNNNNNYDIDDDKSASKETSKNVDSLVRNSSKKKIVMQAEKKSSTRRAGLDQNYSLSKSKSEGNPFHKRKGRIIRIDQRPDVAAQPASQLEMPHIDDSALPENWSRKNDAIYGISDSLYDRNQVTKNRNGDPIADCFGIIARDDSAILAVADGVNWGEKACVAAKSAVHGCLHYLNKTIFNDTKLFENLTTSKNSGEENNPSLESSLNYHRIGNTRDIFVCLLRAFNCAHDLILENQGMLTTLTVAVVLPLRHKSKKNESSTTSEKKYICCVCNVGDTLAYVYSQKYGVRELTRGSHDINCNRDMRDALGALGPVDGINPELSNLTLSITTMQKGDIIMVASDGLTDNFDPNVCKFTVNSSNVLPSVDGMKIKKPSTSSSIKKQPNPPIKPPRRTRSNKSHSGSDRSSSSSVEVATSSNVNTEQSINDAISPSIEESIKNDTKKSVDNDANFDNNPLIAEFMKENAVDKSTKSINKSALVVENKASSLRRQASSHKNKSAPSVVENYKFLRSKTTIDVRSTTSSLKPILRNPDGIPYVTPIQRYELQLLFIEDILKNGISGKEMPCKSARKLCENLVSFTFSITSAKRRTLEDPDLYFDNRGGVSVEVSQQEKKLRRKKGLERVQNLPGKLDHVSVVAWNVGNVRV